MDEFFFRLNNQCESIQIEGTAIVQQIYQWILSCISQTKQLLYSINNEFSNLQFKNIGPILSQFLNKLIEQINYQYTSILINSKDICQQFGSHCLNDISRRDIAYCTLGITIGGLIGYSIGFNLRSTARRIQSMKALICQNYIGFEGVTLVEDAEMPTIQRPNEVLIQVKAASLNIIDAKITNGYSKLYRGLLNSGLHKELPVILGRDCSGIVVEIGRNVVNFDIGDEVYLALPSWSSGTMAEYLVIDNNKVSKKPKNQTFEASACLPYNGCIAWDALANNAKITEGNAKGKRFLIYGGSTPVGCLLIQLIKLWGGHVTAVCKYEATKVLLALGAHVIIPLDECHVEKELELHDTFHTIFYTGDYNIDQRLLKRHLRLGGNIISTLPDNLTSDSFGFITGNIFSGYIRLKILFQHIFGIDKHHWNDGSKIKTSTLDIIRQLVNNNQLQGVVGAAFRPLHIDEALNHVVNPNAIGSTIIKF